MEPRVKLSRIRLDAANFCQLRCPICATTAGLTRQHVGSTYLRASDFRELVDENPHISSIELSHAGEVFLNPELPQILAYAYEKGISVTMDNGANFNSVSEEALEALVKYRVRSIFVAIDGATPETYAKYRIRGDFEAVIRNIRRVNHYKEVYRSKFPYLIWQYIVFDFNESEVPQARELSKQLRMGFLTKPSMDPGYAPENTGAGAKPAGSRAQRPSSSYGWATRLHCGQMWHGPQISSNGKVLGCCRNITFGDYGNVFESSVEECLNGDRMLRARNQLMGQGPECPDVPCTQCPIYHEMKRSKTWIRPWEIRLFALLGWVRSKYMLPHRTFSYVYDRVLKAL
jgi:hypothetical protein